MTINSFQNIGLDIEEFEEIDEEDDKSYSPVMI